MKRQLIFALLGILLFSFSSADQVCLSDDFNDGDTDGWQLLIGNWRVENGTFVQDLGGDNRIALIENRVFSSQIVEAEAKFNDPSGYGGIILWFQDINNLIKVRIYPAVSRIYINEYVDSIENSSWYSYPSSNNMWVNLKVEANNKTGALDIYANDDHIFTYNVTSIKRTGKTGLFNGNAGGYFDNFSICAEQEQPPAPSIEYRISELEDKVEDLTSRVTYLENQNCEWNSNDEDLENRIDDLENKTSWLEDKMNEIIEFISNGLPRGLGKRFK
jgi:uncharacterized coiled-coil protein SlyX